jgi:alanyl-tRNA synthetase
LGLNLEEFDKAVGAHRDTAKAAHIIGGGMGIVDKYAGLNHKNVTFVGYEAFKQDAIVLGLLYENKPVDNVSCGQKIELVLNQTPFYPEGGGQVGDTGFIEGPNGVVQIFDTQSPLASLIVHYGQVISGNICLNDEVIATVDMRRRIDTARNHSGTHILHASLREVLGLHVRQAGSLVAPERLRFDYSHVGPLTNEELMSVQSLSNERVRDDLKVMVHETTYAEAIKQGALAFFGDKYGDKVRVVEMSASNSSGPFSLELCGGTHVHATGQVGPIFLLGESGIGGGMRRLEAVTGFGAERLFVERSTLLEKLSKRFDVPHSELENRLNNFVEELSFLRKEIAVSEQRNVVSEADKLVESIIQVNGINVLSTRSNLTNVDSLRQMGDSLKNRMPSLVLVLAAIVNEKALLISMVTPDLVAKGLKAGQIIKEIAQHIGGSGGGNAELAQAGGKRTEGLGKALSLVPKIVEREVNP